LWDLVWRGVLTNDTFHALRAFTAANAPRRRARRGEAPAFRSRRLVPPSAEGRWSVVPAPIATAARATTAAAALAQQLLARHGVLTREAIAIETVVGGFAAIYPVLKAMEEHGRIRRGYFVAGLGATQFALPGAVDLLRSLRMVGDDPEVVALAATDPANPYGAALRWPAAAPDGASARQVEIAKAGRGPTRSVGATVILVDGALAAYLARGDRVLLTWLPDAEPQRSRAAHAIARVLIDRARSGGDALRGMLIEEIDGHQPQHHPLAPFLAEAGFSAGAMGYQATFVKFAGHA
jgi:ATP-dependent Lhr-like helicase